jgi:PAS domain S-box-containing protein
MSIFHKVKHFFCSKLCSNSKIDVAVEDVKNSIDELKQCLSSFDLRETKRKMKAEINLRNAVLDNLADMVWAKDLDGKYLMTNKAFRDKFCYGLRDDEILGKNDIQLAKEFKTKVGNNNHTFGEMCFNSDEVIKEIEDAKEFLELGLIDGKMMKLVVNKSPFRDYRGNMFAICGSGRDITEWHTAMEKAIEGDNSCFPETKNLILKELNRLEFKNLDKGDL